jgi:hypothetical protein
MTTWHKSYKLQKLWHFYSRLSKHAIQANCHNYLASPSCSCFADEMKSNNRKAYSGKKSSLVMSRPFFMSTTM